ncbi:flagellar hook assembly protein FlgD [bacterium]|nr:flagellar hook assembly protein FlgD [bacterium]
MPIAGITDGRGPVLGQAGRDYSQVSKLDFMALLVAQIKNQDPTSPMDNAQFTSQITQFSMLEQLETMSGALQDNVAVGTAINNTAMLALVGRNVTVAGNDVSLSGGLASESVIAAGANGRATIKITDENGRVVRTYEQSVTKGLNTVTWDGRTDDDVVAPDGKYTISAEVKDNSGAAVTFTNLMTGAVTGLRYSDNQAIVMVNGEEFYVSEIYKVS